MSGAEFRAEGGLVRGLGLPEPVQQPFELRCLAEVEPGDALVHGAVLLGGVGGLGAGQGGDVVLHLGEDEEAAVVDGRKLQDAAAHRVDPLLVLEIEALREGRVAGPGGGRVLGVCAMSSDGDANTTWYFCFLVVFFLLLTTWKKGVKVTK